MASAEDDLLQEAKERFALALEESAECREQQLSDLRFSRGDQWPGVVRRMREEDPNGPRPCLTVNKAAANVRQVTNAIRQARPQIRVHPVDNHGDAETASMLNGLLRHIQTTSLADIAYDTAVDFQVTGGEGEFAIGTRLVDPDSNQQEIVVLPIVNPFSVYRDPHIEICTGQDANWCFLAETSSVQDIERKYGKKVAGEVSSWGELGRGEGNTLTGANDENRPRIVRYWYRLPAQKVKMVEAADGTRMSVELYQAKWGDRPERPQVLREFTTEKPEVRWAKMHGSGVLEDNDWPGQYIPIVRVVGEEMWVDGKRDVRGLVRDIAEPCRIYNYQASAYNEHVALSTKAPWLVADEAVEGHEDEWARANSSNVNYLGYNAIDSAGNPVPVPSRNVGTPTEPGIMQAMMLAADDIKSASGQFGESMGDATNATSGRAIRARQQEGSLATHHYSDNLARSLRYAGLVILDLVPHIYDTPRVARILGEDGEPDFAKIEPTSQTAYAEVEDERGGIEKIYNPGVGKYDVVVSVGPSYLTRRQEQAEAMGEVLSNAPDLWPVMGDLLVRAMDWPDSESMADRLKMMLPPEIKQMEEAREGGKNEATAQMQAMQEQMRQQMAQIIEEAEAALQEVGQESAEKDEIITQMKLQLQNKDGEFLLKQAELQIKDKEVDLRAQADNTKAEADVATAYIAANAQPGGEGESAENSEEGPGMMMLIQQMMARMNELEQGPGRADDKATMLLNEAARQIGEMAAARSKTVEAVARFASSDGSEASLAQALSEVADSAPETGADMPQEANVETLGVSAALQQVLARMQSMESAMNQATQQTVQMVSTTADAVDNLAEQVAGMADARGTTLDAVMQYMGSDQSDEALEDVIETVQSVN